MLSPVNNSISVESPHGDVARTCRLFNVRLHPELSDLLERYAASQRMTTETIIAEAVRAYLGADA